MQQEVTPVADAVIEAQILAVQTLAGLSSTLRTSAVRTLVV